MRAVLGIDAAWTLERPSGVAVVREFPEGWRLIAAASSYQRFLDIDHLADLRPDAAALLASASKLCSCLIDLVAIDMPLARTPIVRRRFSDDAVSRAYGGRKCGTHTPSASRPGRISDDLRAGFENAGYLLQTVALAPPGLIEVYPHPALVELANATERLPYKASKIRAYWPSATRLERRVRLYAQWKEIVVLLERQIANVAATLPALDPDAPVAEIKAYEDTLDAIVCAWVGICALEHRAKPFGDDDSAIWVPQQPLQGNDRDTPVQPTR